MKWIPITNSLPPVKEDYGIFSNSIDVLATDGVTVLAAHLQRRDDGSFQWEMTGPDGWNFDNVTHWMPLPKPPVSL